MTTTKTKSKSLLKELQHINKQRAEFKTGDNLVVKQPLVEKFTQYRPRNYFLLLVFILLLITFYKLKY